MQKIIWLTLLLAHTAGAKDEIPVPCRYELRAAQFHMVRREWPLARASLTAALARCRDMAAVQAGAKLAANLPVNPKQEPVVEVGLRANGALIKSDTGWFVRLKDPGDLSRIQLDYETMGQKLLDADYGPKILKGCEKGVDGKITCYSSDFIKTLPLPGLYKVTVVTAARTRAYQVILSEEDFRFAVARLEAPSAAYQTLFTRKVNYVVEESGPGISEFEFQLMRTESPSKDPFTTYTFPAAGFKRRGSIDVPDAGDYRLQFTTRQILRRGDVSLVLENAVGRRFEIK